MVYTPKQSNHPHELPIQKYLCVYILTNNPYTQSKEPILDDGLSLHQQLQKFNKIQLDQRLLSDARGH